MSSLIAYRRRNLGASLAIAVSFLILGGLAFAEQEPLRIPRVKRPPKLSDFINGTPREAEAVITVFTQLNPHDGEVISAPTAAYLSYDSKNLYIGWICKDDPAEIRARMAQREHIGADDRVTINIDTFQDNKHAYWFDVNPYGVQSDGRTTDGIGDDASWEGLWYSDGRITQDGYAVLETIPFRSLRFPRARKQIWNICLARMIPRTNEFAAWPYISRKRMPEFVGQFAPIELDADVSAGRNIQLTPYGIYSSDRYLDADKGIQHEVQHHPGLDVKAVIKDALTLDLTVNPDFAEIGSDDPRVKVNQRYEVLYPERRPFFLENASVFSTPEPLFFSRRIVDPQFGAKLTGSLGRWNLGALATDDRAPGEVLAQGQTGHGDRGMNAVVRAEREFGHQSHAGIFLSNTNFQSTSNRVGSLDLRYLAPHNWTITGQTTASQTSDSSGGNHSGSSFGLGISETGNHAYFETGYTDRSPGLVATLGSLERTDVRWWDTYYSYRWRPPENQTLLSFGPGIGFSLNHDHEQRLQNWSVGPSFSLSLPRQTSLSMRHSESYELYSGIGLRENYSSMNLSTSWYKWLQLGASYGQGNQPNYYPPEGLSPFLASANNAAASVTLRPQRRLRFDEIYYYTRLAANSDSLVSAPAASGDIFTNHLIRSKINYQFNRDYSFNAIFDYNSLLPNNALVTSTYSKQADTTLLFTYFPHPGTAFFLGYADNFQNLNYNAASTPAFTITGVPSTSTDRQVFVKVSYLLHF